MFYQDYGGVFRRFTGKRVLSDLRGGDYAHAGGAEAVNRVFQRFLKNEGYSILDVGCGQGGTAHLVQNNTWGKVTGFDIEEESIAYAKRKYPDINFFVGDASDENQLYRVLKDKKFDIIYMLHSLCVFPKQLEALQAIRKFAHSQTVLAIFEYDDITNGNSPLKRTEDVNKYFNVLSRNEFKHMLTHSGWFISNDDIVDITTDFQRWYMELVINLELMQEIITARYGEEYFNNAKKRYGGMLNAIEQNKLGGCIIYATAI